ncbi:hypothetical protein [Bradyrhizobium sp. NAS96.2]|nr:hypothetical protein [Bradyrhizobium sp. NAS96.2]
MYTTLYLTAIWLLINALFFVMVTTADNLPDSVEASGNLQIWG